MQSAECIDFCAQSDRLSITAVAVAAELHAWRS